MLNRFAQWMSTPFERLAYRYFAYNAHYNTPSFKHQDLINGVSQIQQIHLMLTYRRMLQEGAKLPSFEDIEFRCYSQNGEDGILWYIFALIGVTNKHAVEICAGDGIECNTANLLTNHGWIGLLFDGNARNVQRARTFYSVFPSTRALQPQFLNEWVTAENVNDLVRTHQFEGEIDLLSLDMDGVEWWVWKALDVIRPRVVILEYKHVWGATKSVTVPYAPDFYAGKDGKNPQYYGASLSAFVKLGREKGYRLVGIQRYGFNAFFVRDDIAADILPEVSPETCYQHPMVRWLVKPDEQSAMSENWVEV
ncbi:MAG: hypothetical protein SGI73_19245 [Chloroflexota bacterium]|nr:hypothetical protein [Chloroflexota bacterium]